MGAKSKLEADHRGDPIEVDQVRSVNAHEAPRIQPGGKVGKVHVYQVAPAAGMDRDVIAVRLTTHDVRDLNGNDLAAIANEEPRQRFWLRGLAAAFAHDGESINERS